MSAHSVTQTVSFEIGVYKEDDAIDPKTGAINLTKIHVYGKPSADVMDLRVTATLSSVRQGVGQFVGVLTARMGAVKAGQKVDYAGSACECAPSNMIVQPGAQLTADVIALYTDGTQIVSGPVEWYPPSSRPEPEKFTDSGDRERVATSTIGTAVEFLGDCTVRDDDGTVTLSDLAKAYNDWCARKGLKPLRKADVVGTIKSTFDLHKVRSERLGKDMRFQGVRLST